ncbi:MAG: hypothetical protein Q8R81_10620 [Novosphingobium sp.]|uniref:hypothetical protein n=1 Tax=Novosphingobium sp. TaxID=1874826 RepID=UPI002735CE3D|nr:hypothetical protein [Novosphingobium sp.]MDP3550836.1 hypothetical protein [Novosphingobium sp.]
MQQFLLAVAKMQLLPLCYTLRVYLVILEGHLTAQGNYLSLAQPLMSPRRNIVILVSHETGFGASGSAAKGRWHRVGKG